MLARLTFAAALAAATPAFAEIGEDGLHKEPWFALTFKDVADDIEAAAAQDKRLAIVFEQRGCIYCAKMHEEILSDPEVAEYISNNFMIVQYNMFGDEEVIDIDGEALTEKEAVRRWGVVFTPTIIFLPESVPEEPDATVADAAVATMPGAFGKLTFLNMFRWIDEKGYEGEEHFQKYHARRLEEMRTAGEPIGE